MYSTKEPKRQGQFGMITREQIRIEAQLGEHAAATIRVFQAATTWANGNTGSVYAGMTMTELADLACVRKNHIARYLKKTIAVGLLHRVEVRPGEHAIFVNPTFAYHPQQVTSSGDSDGDEVTSSGDSPCTPYIESEDTEEESEPPMVPQRGRREVKPGLVVTPKGEFELFWSAYPHKVSKGHARKAFQAAIRKVDLETMLAAINLYVATKPPDRPYCNPGTWLNGERWNDEPGFVKPKLSNIMVGASAAMIGIAAKRDAERKLGRPLSYDEQHKIDEAAMVRAEANEILEQREHARLVAAAVADGNVIDAFSGIDTAADPPVSPRVAVDLDKESHRLPECQKQYPRCYTRWVQRGTVCQEECKAVIPDFFPYAAKGR